ncbi:MAG: response regulator [Actinobacteria bacterium]|nr:response regulator [Actinomycetota bacterium]
MKLSISRLTSIASRMGLRTKLLILTVGIVLLVGILMTVIIETLVTGYVSRELDEWGTSVAVNLADTTVEPLLTDDVMETHHLLETTINTYGDVSYAYITDSNGDVVADTFSEGFPTDLLAVNYLAAGEDRSLQLLETESGIVRDIAVPIQEGRIGVVHIGIQEDLLYQQIAQTRNRMLLLVLVLSALGAGAVMLLGNVAMRPLKVLADGARRFGSGELDVQVPVSTSDEIGTLSSSFNEMARELKAKIGEINETRKQYETLVGNIPDVVYSIAADGSGQPLFISPKWTELTGYPVEDSPDVWFRPIHPDDRESAKARCEQAIAEGRECSYEFRVIHGITGKLRHVSNHGIPIHDSEGELVRYDGIFSDVTERRLVEEKLLQSQKMESIGQLAGGVAHDLNNYMMAIQGYTDLTMGMVAPDSEEYQNLAEARRSMERVTELTRQLLLFGRRSEVDLRPTDINSVVSGLTGMLPHLVGERYQLITELADGALVINCDPGLIEQAVMNLVVNARDAMPDGGRITISTTRMVPGGRACLSVEDSGHGMDEATISHIFEPFFTTKPAGQGTGLGLSVIYSIVEQHDGKVEVDSVPGSGSRFNICFPLLKQARDGIAASKPASGESRGRGEKILVVEDEESVRTLVEKVLRANGYTVVSAATAGDAHVVFSEDEDGIRLIMSDIVLPDVNGVQLVEELTLRKPGVAVLLSSGYAADYIDKQGIEAKGYRFLQKPYDLDLLLGEISEILRIGADPADERH